MIAEDAGKEDAARFADYLRNVAGTIVVDYNGE